MTLNFKYGTNFFDFINMNIVHKYFMILVSKLAFGCT